MEEIANIRGRDSIAQYIAKRDLLEVLTPAQFAVGELVVKGFKNKEIAEILGIVEGTVQNHRNACRVKLKARTTVDLVRIWTGQLPLPPVILPSPKPIYYPSSLDVTLVNLHCITLRLKQILEPKEYNL
jgi:DNA-binding CsgD family transcriptional regulator